MTAEESRKEEANKTDRAVAGGRILIARARGLEGFADGARRRSGSRTGRAFRGRGRLPITNRPRRLPLPQLERGIPFVGI